MGNPSDTLGIAPRGVGPPPAGPVTRGGPWGAGVRRQRLEPQRDAGAEAVGALPHQRRHLGHEGALALRGDGLLRLLLAHRGPLELLHQLPPLVGARAAGGDGVVLGLGHPTRGHGQGG